jgi:hypothetical protein
LAITSAKSPSCRIDVLSKIVSALCLYPGIQLAAWVALNHQSEIKVLWEKRICDHDQ